jgi:hypothetical protein
MKEVLFDPRDFGEGYLSEIDAAIREVAREAVAKGRKVRLLVMVARSPWEVSR